MRNLFDYVVLKLKYELLLKKYNDLKSLIDVEFWELDNYDLCSR